MASPPASVNAQVLFELLFEEEHRKAMMNSRVMKKARAGGRTWPVVRHQVNMHQRWTSRGPPAAQAELRGSLRTGPQGADGRGAAASAAPRTRAPVGEQFPHVDPGMNW